MLAALSGIEAGITRMAVSAHNTANLNTDGYRALRVTQSETPAGGAQTHIVRTDAPADYATESVEQMTAGYAVKAGVVALRAANDMAGELMNILA